LRLRLVTATLDVARLIMELAVIDKPIDSILKISETHGCARPWQQLARRGGRNRKPGGGDINCLGYANYRRRETNLPEPHRPLIRPFRHVVDSVSHQLVRPIQKATLRRNDETRRVVARPARHDVQIADALVCTCSCAVVGFDNARCGSGVRHTLPVLWSSMPKILGPKTCASTLRQRLWATMSNNHELKSQLYSFA
jgi:hypothetical protein